MTREQFIKKRKYLFWYIKEPEKNIDDASLVEHVLNYGDWDDVQKLIKLLGIKKVAKIFREKTSGKRTNYSKLTANFFKLYFSKHA